MAEHRRQETQPLPSAGPEAERHGDDPKQQHVYEAAPRAVSANGAMPRPSAVETMKQGSLGFDGGEEQTERKNNEGNK